MLAALAEHPEAVGADIGAVERARLGDAAAGGDEQVDEGAVTQVAKARGGKRGEQPGHGLGGDGMGIADGVAGHHHHPAELLTGPALVVRIGEEPAQRHERPSAGARMGEHLGEVDLVAAQPLAVDRGAEVVAERLGAHVGDELGQIDAPARCRPA